MSSLVDTDLEFLWSWLLSWISWSIWVQILFPFWLTELADLHSWVSVVNLHQAWLLSPCDHIASSPPYQPLHFVCFIVRTFIVPYNMYSNVMIFVMFTAHFLVLLSCFSGTSFLSPLFLPNKYISGLGYWPPWVCFKFSLFQEVMTCFITVSCYCVNSSFYKSLRVPHCFGIEPWSLRLFFTSITTLREGSCLYIMFHLLAMAPKLQKHWFGGWLHT